MQLIQLKYEMIYEGFGGDKSRAPKIYLSENRLPMLSLIKQQIRQIGELLSNADDYLVQRNLWQLLCSHSSGTVSMLRYASKANLPF